MSYCRFGWGGSEAYIYESVYGGIQCCGCLLSDRSWNTPSGLEYDPDDDGSRRQPREAYDEMIAHVREHLAAGHVVPLDVIPRLEADRDGVELVLTPEQEASRRAVNTDLLNFMGVKDPDLREEWGADREFTVHPSKAGRDG